MDRPVLDSSALLAVIFGEPGTEKVEPLLQGALVSAVNLAETHTRLLLKGVPAEFAWSRLLGMGFDIRSFDEDLARIAAELVTETRRLGLCLGDRACLALAIQRQATVYTTVKVWKSLSLGVPVEVIR